MSLRIILWIIAAILMAISAFVESPKSTLSTIAWSLFILGWAAGGAGVN